MGLRAEKAELEKGTCSSLRKISDTIWEISSDYKAGMRVPARFFGTENLVKTLDSAVFEQIANVATLPGIIDFALCMPDGHSGYGFPIGGVAAMDPRSGVISPGGIGFDINCGMRLVRSNLTVKEITPFIHQLVDRLFHRVPAGVGSTGFVHLSPHNFREILEQGSRWCLNNGYAWNEDLELTEDFGCASGADSSKVSSEIFHRDPSDLGLHMIYDIAHNTAKLEEHEVHGKAGGSYKDIDEVIQATQLAGLDRPVAKFTPIGNVKG
ncbi:MAG: RtcB family protein [Bdellovibrionia bacterium]